MPTVQELYGLKAIVMFIHALPVTRKSVPSLISNAVELIKDIRTIVDTHKVDIYITLHDITLHYSSNPFGVPWIFTNKGYNHPLASQVRLIIDHSLKYLPHIYTLIYSTDFQ